MSNRTPLILRMRTREKIQLARRLSLYLKAGISLPRAFAYIREGKMSRSTKHIVTMIEASIMNGEPLSSGFGKFPKQFDAFILGTLEAGESSGTLPGTLSRLADTLEKRQALRRKIVSALLYPIIVLVSTLGITSFLLFYIFPKILPVLQGLKTTLPFTTRMLIGITMVVQTHWVLILVSAFVACASMGGLRSVRVIRRTTERVLMRIPIAGSLYMNYSLAMALTILSLQLEGTVRIVEALSLIERSLRGEVYRDAFRSIQHDLLRGHPLSYSLRRFTTLFPLEIVQLIAAGETTGTIRENVGVLARTYERNLDENTQNMTSLIEPILMVVMGCVVGFVALAIITPIYAITQNLSA